MVGLLAFKIGEKKMKEVEAIAIKWIEERIKQKEREAMRARNADNFEAMNNLNHTIWELECLLEDWRKENED